MTKLKEMNDSTVKSVEEAAEEVAAKVSNLPKGGDGGDKGSSVPSLSLSVSRPIYAARASDHHARPAPRRTPPLRAVLATHGRRVAEALARALCTGKNSDARARW